MKKIESACIRVKWSENMKQHNFQKHIYNLLGASVNGKQVLCMMGQKNLSSVQQYKKMLVWPLFLISSELQVLQKGDLQASLHSLCSEHLEDFAQCFPSLIVASVRKTQFQFLTFRLLIFFPYQASVYYAKDIEITAYCTYKAENKARQRWQLSLQKYSGIHPEKQD